jgi:3-dehydro-L-gulonate 2-dehydrogenase
MSKYLRMRLPFEEIEDLLYHILLDHGFPEKKARLIANVHCQSSCDGVYSHGLNRFPLFIEYVRKGYVKPEANPECIQTFGAIEQWDGKLGSGIWNASQAMDHLLAITPKFGLGMIALRNTNHWMRGGTYGWQAADAGMLTLCFTNTKPNMPPWGGKDSRIGNNPLVIGVPKADGLHLVLDMSLSQFSFGKMNEYKLKGKKLPFPGGWDDNDTLSNDPERILSKERALPIGYWKGSAFSMMLDVVASMLSMGNSTYRIGLEKIETGISQIFLCLDPRRFGSRDKQEEIIDEIIEYVHKADLLDPDKTTRYPGEQTIRIRNENRRNGIPINGDIWNEILSLTK